MTARERKALLLKVELKAGQRNVILQDLGIPRSTYYKWRSEYDKNGLRGLEKKKTGPKRAWNKLRFVEEEKILEEARFYPELSSRLLSVKISKEEDFTVSESTVFRILKEQGLIAPRPLPSMPAAKEWSHKTTKPDQIWQCDGTNLFIADWGRYKLIPVEDDYSRKIIGHDLKPDETGFSISDVVEIAVENAIEEGHLIDRKKMPLLFTDNGSGFCSSRSDSCYRRNNLLFPVYIRQ
ncbi:helix-turn-helix domain-containing protein [bacterium]|nr:helix-turn-helix domain-containing protein [bacterium]